MALPILLSAKEALAMALENRSFIRQLVYLLLIFVILLGVMSVLARWGW